MRIVERWFCAREMTRTDLARRWYALDMSITVHHLNFSRSLRVLWLLEELEVDYAIQFWKRDENFRAPSSAAEVHPLGRFPMVEVDGRVLVESGAVLEYFADREGKLRPTDETEKLECTMFLHYAEGSLMPPLLVQLISSRVRSAPVPFFIKPIARGIAIKIDESYTRPALDLHLGFVEKTLSERPYFAGESFSIADIQMFYAVEAALSRGSGERPHMRAWRDRVASRPAYQRAEAKGGKAVPPRAG
jgi:glutathione S-transferase